MATFRVGYYITGWLYYHIHAVDHCAAMRVLKRQTLKGGPNNFRLKKNPILIESAEPFVDERPDGIDDKHLQRGLKDHEIQELTSRVTRAVGEALMDAPQCTREIVSSAITKYLREKGMAIDEQNREKTRRDQEDAASDNDGSG